MTATKKDSAEAVITDELFKFKIFFSIETKSNDEKVRSKMINSYVQNLISDFKNSNEEFFENA